MSVDPQKLCGGYLEAVHELLARIDRDEQHALAAAARLLADQIAADRLVHVFGPAATPTWRRRRCSSAPAG